MKERKTRKAVLIEILIDSHATRAWCSLARGIISLSRTPINNPRPAPTHFFPSNSASFIDQNQAYTLIISYIVCGLQKFQYRWFLVFFSLSLTLARAYLIGVLRLVPHEKKAKSTGTAVA